ncbi:MAG: hypothetical protein JSV66_13275 [Trueperaceae bacterium]|nr:MAG: hypothetical protein JSV66_13275 [Trueperaceae bacterium]
MSTYQYYEFQAVDRPLTRQQMDELREYSTRAQITPSSFVNFYDWGDLRGDPERWIEEYFDTFLYLANWGSRWFMLRLPEKLLSQELAASYCAGDSFTCRQSDGNLILSFESLEEDYEWVDGEGWLGSLVPLRSDLMRGDHRALYLGWLLAVQSEEVGRDVLEPAVPPGLGELNASLVRFCDFLRIDSDLIAAAAERSPGKRATALSREEIRAWIAALPVAEKDELLFRLVEGDDPNLAVVLEQRATLELRGGSESDRGARRTVGELVAYTELLTEARVKREAEEYAREQARIEQEEAEQRQEYLESLFGKEEKLWAKIESLVAAKQPKKYDEAVLLLEDLRDLAEMEGDRVAFFQRLSALYRQHTRKTSFVDRLLKAKLLG